MKKVLLLVLVALAAFGSTHATSTERETALFARLTEVNRYWFGHETAAPAHVQPLANDRAMIALHLQLVEKALRAKDVSHLPAALRQARTQNLNTLNRYWKSGAFPINTTHAYRLPIFIDPFDNFCAVGFLIKESGHEALSRHISANTNFAYLADMQYPELDVWAANSGLTKDELAWIQPGYTPAPAIDAMLGGTNGVVRAMAQDPAMGGIFAVGEFTQAGGQPVSNTGHYGMGFAGPFWAGMGPGLAPSVSALQWFNGELYAAGSDLLPTGASHSVVKWNGNGWSITAPGTAPVKALAVYNNELYAGGSYGSMGAYLARWNGSNWINLLPATGLSVNGTVHALHVHDNKLIIGGDFTTGAIGSDNILQYDGSQFSGVGGGFPSGVRSLATYKGRLFAGGLFVSIQGINHGFARLDGNTWTNLLHHPSGYNPMDPNNTTPGSGVFALATRNDEQLIVGGNFITYPMGVGYHGTNLSRYFESTDGSSWGFGGLAMLDQPVYSLLFDNTTNHLYLGGAFTHSVAGQLGGIGMLEMAPLAANDPVTQSAPAVFPNPFSDVATVQVPQLKANQTATLMLFDVMGRKVLEQQQLVTADNSLTVNRTELPAGTYLLRVQQDNQLTGLSRLVVQ